MHNSGRSLFTTDGDTITPTEYSRGPWDPRACHGGPIAMLLVHAVEHVDDGGGPWQLTRITIDLMRPVPVLAPLRRSAVVERPGRMVSLVASSLTTADGTEVARARVLRIRRAEVTLTEGVMAEPPFGEPGDGIVGPHAAWATDDIGFHKDSVELAFSDGTFDTLGPIAMWCRLLVPLFEGEEPTGAQRVMAAADFGNGVASELDGEHLMFINPDLTVHLLRPAVGEWIGMTARCHYGDEGAGMSDAALYDSSGRLGRAAQSILIAPR